MNWKRLVCLGCALILLRIGAEELQLALTCGGRRTMNVDDLRELRNRLPLWAEVEGLALLQTPELKLGGGSRWGQAMTCAELDEPILVVLKSSTPETAASTKAEGLVHLPTAEQREEIEQAFFRLGIRLASDFRVLDEDRRPMPVQVGAAITFVGFLALFLLLGPRPQGESVPGKITRVRAPATETQGTG